MTTCSSLIRARHGGRARLEGSVALATFVVIAIVSAPRAPVLSRDHWFFNPTARVNIPRRGRVLHATFGRIGTRASARCLRSRPSYPAATHVLHRSRGAFLRPGFSSSLFTFVAANPDRGVGGTPRGAQP